jgi:hypothetical protein
VALLRPEPKGQLALPLWIPVRQLDSWTVYTLLIRPFAWRFALRQTRGSDRICAARSVLKQILLFFSPITWSSLAISRYAAEIKVFAPARRSSFGEEGQILKKTDEIKEIKSSESCMKA